MPSRFGAGTCKVPGNCEEWWCRGGSGGAEPVHGRCYVWEGARDWARGEDWGGDDEGEGDGEGWEGEESFLYVLLGLVGREEGEVCGVVAAVTAFFDC